MPSRGNAECRGRVKNVERGRCICCMLRSMSKPAFFERTFTFCSVCPLRHSRRHGWAKSTLPRCRWLFMGGRSFVSLGIAYFILTGTLIFYHGPKAMLAAAIGKDTKGLALLVVYFVSISFPYHCPSLAPRRLRWICSGRRDVAAPRPTYRE